MKSKRQSPIWIQGAFVQFDDVNFGWKRREWDKMLGAMLAVGMKTIIVQYLELRTKDAVTAAAFLAVGKQDPVQWILEYAEKNAMKVLVGLRLDERLEASEFLNDPLKLQPALDDELKRNVRLVKRVAADYHLVKRACFEGWYLPLEVANYRDTAAVPANGWVTRLSKFTADLVREARRLAQGRIAVSPYFDPQDADGLVAADMGTQYCRFLKGTGIDQVFVQDGVGSFGIPFDRIAKIVGPYLKHLKKACKDASTATRPIEFGVNVESVHADITRLQIQMDVARPISPYMVTFDFPHHMYGTPLLDDYKKLVGT